MPLSLSSYKNSKELMTLLETNNMIKLVMLMLEELLKEVCSVPHKSKMDHIQETWDGMPPLPQETDRD